MSAPAEATNGQPPSGVAAAAVKGHARPSTQYPKYTLEDALRVARAIEDNNAGQPCPPIETANAMRVSPGSSRFQMLLSASLRYGLTTGNYKSERIGLTAAGSEIVAPVSEEAVAAALVTAALAPPTFRSAYDFFKGRKLSEGEFFVNTFIREFDVPKDDAERCSQIFLANMQFVGLTQETTSGPWLSTQIPTTRTATQTEIDADVEDRADGSSVVLALPPDVPSGLPPSTAPAAANEPPRPQAIFVAGRKGKSLDQLVKILDEYKLPHLLAEDEPNRARPISTKVAETMEQCGAAIIVFTPDEELRDLESNPVWRPSQNIVHELGAAGAAYGNRIVIFREERVDLAANYSDIGHITFKDGELHAKAIELFRELISFGLVTVTVGGS